MTALATDVALAAAGLAVAWLVIGGGLVAVTIHLAHGYFRNRGQSPHP